MSVNLNICKTVINALAAHIERSLQADNKREKNKRLLKLYKGTKFEVVFARRLGLAPPEPKTAKVPGKRPAWANNIG